MKLFKIDTNYWTVREVDGEGWPTKDSEGDTCFDNTHFPEKRQAVEKLEREAAAWVELTARDVADAKQSLASAEEFERRAKAAHTKTLGVLEEFQNAEGEHHAK